MTETSSYPGYATPTFRRSSHDNHWLVKADPQGLIIGRVYDYGSVGWIANDASSHRVGLFPDKQAAGEALVKHAGYEVLR